MSRYPLPGTLVVKVGGAAGVAVDEICGRLTRLAETVDNLVIVHGASNETDRLCEANGFVPRTLTSPSGHVSRHTDARTRDFFVAAAQKVNQEIRDCLQGAAVSPVGLCDAESIALRARRKKALRAMVDGRARIIRDDYSGIIRDVDVARLRAHLTAGRVPVLPPLAISEDGLLNIDGDRAAAAVAAALGAGVLVILSNVRGIYRNFPREDSLVAEVPATQLDEAMIWAQGRMKRKVLSAREAFEEEDVQRVFIGNRVPEVSDNMLNFAGTVFLR